jgi:hypothetical protein
MKKKFWILALCLLLIAAVAVGIFMNHNRLSPQRIRSYNTAATQRAWKQSLIGNNDIMILKSVTRDPQGDTKVEFNIYRLPAGAMASNFLDKQVSDLDANAGLELMGSGSCTFIGDDLAAIYNLSTVFLK